MTHQRLREKAEVAKDWMGTDWFDDDWSVLRPFDFECSDFIKECTPETILSLLAELDAARKDAERLDDQRLTLVNVFKQMGIDPLSKGWKWTESEQAAIDAALNADREKVK